MENAKNYDYCKGMFDAYGEILKGLIEKGEEANDKGDNELCDAYGVMAIECLNRRGELLLEMIEYVKDEVLEEINKG